MRSDRERGSGTVLMAGFVGALLALLLGGLALSSAVVASHRARSAADLGALAGASLAIRGGSVSAVCAAARRIVDAHAARLRSCHSSGGEVRLEVSVASRWPGLGPAVAAARAGPAVAPARAGPVG